MEKSIEHFLSQGKLKELNDFCQIEEDLNAMYCLLWKILSGTLGVIAVVVILTKYPQYLGTLHENQLWFSHIKVSLQSLFQLWCFFTLMTEIMNVLCVAMRSRRA